MNLCTKDMINMYHKTISFTTENKLCKKRKGQQSV